MSSILSDEDAFLVIKEPTRFLILLKNYSRVTTLLKSFDTDVKKKATTFSKDEFDLFVGSADYSTPYWLVRKV